MICRGCGVTLIDGLPCVCRGIRVVTHPNDSIRRIIYGGALENESQYMQELGSFGSLNPNHPLYQLIENNIPRNDYFENNREFPTNVKFRITEEAYKKILEFKTTPECEKECEGGKCVICTETYSKEDSVIMPCCKQEIHKKCLEEWVFKSSPTCPLCRNDKFEKEIQENTL